MDMEEKKRVRWQYVVVTLFAFAFGFCVFRGVRAHAEESMPAKMEATDAAQLDAALAHIREIFSQAKPYDDRVKEICQKYRISPDELGKTVGVNFATGEIMRAKAAQFQANTAKPTSDKK